MSIELLFQAEDHTNFVHDNFYQTMDNKLTQKQLKDVVFLKLGIDHSDQRLFSEDGREIEGFGRQSIEIHKLQDGSKIIVKHRLLERWIEFLAEMEIVANPKSNQKERRTSAKQALSLSELLEGNKFFFFYPTFKVDWRQKRGQAMRLIDRLVPAFKSSAKTFFALKNPGSKIDFEPKRAGMMAGTIVKVTNGDTIKRYFLKTYHRCESPSVISTADRFPPNLIETFAYQLLNYIDVGPVVFFPYYAKSFCIHFIMTKEVECFKNFEEVEDVGLKSRLVVEAYALRLILGITDLDIENFGSDKNDMLSIVDFRPPVGEYVIRRNILNDFKNENKYGQYDISKILSEVRPEKRVEIGRVALDRWLGIRQVTSAIIDDKKADLKKHGIEVENPTDDVEKYIEDIKENYETLRSDLQ